VKGGRFTRVSRHLVLVKCRAGGTGETSVRQARSWELKQGRQRQSSSALLKLGGVACGEGGQLRSGGDREECNVTCDLSEWKAEMGARRGAESEDGALRCGLAPTKVRVVELSRSAALSLTCRRSGTRTLWWCATVATLLSSTRQRSGQRREDERSEINKENNDALQFRLASALVPQLPEGASFGTAEHWGRGRAVIGQPCHGNRKLQVAE
jgi:hypothetical protein